MKIFNSTMLVMVYVFIVASFFTLKQIDKHIKVLACHELNAEVEAFNNCLSDE